MGTNGRGSWPLKGCGLTVPCNFKLNHTWQASICLWNSQRVFFTFNYTQLHSITLNYTKQLTTLPSEVCTPPHIWCVRVHPEAASLGTSRSAPLWVFSERTIGESCLAVESTIFAALPSEACWSVYINLPLSRSCKSKFAPPTLTWPLR